MLNYQRVGWMMVKKISNDGDYDLWMVIMMDLKKKSLGLIWFNDCYSLMMVIMMVIILVWLGESTSGTSYDLGCQGFDENSHLGNLSYQEKCNLAVKLQTISKSRLLSGLIVDHVRWKLPTSEWKLKLSFGSWDQQERLAAHVQCGMWCSPNHHLADQNVAMWLSGSPAEHARLHTWSLSGWWFQTCFIFDNIWDNPSHWLIFFQDG